MQPNRIAAHNSIAQHREGQSNERLHGVSSLPPHLIDVSLSFRELAPDFPLPDLTQTPVSRLIHPSTLYAARPTHKKTLYNVCKRCLDVTASLHLLILLSPLFVLIALLVRLTSRGPVFFAHRRLGLHGKQFGCLKFRTMTVDADERLKQDLNLRRQFEDRFKLENDPRVTPLGSFLRQTSLDELPQLFHVLRGEMSLVGPRPIVEPELVKYSIYAKKLLSVRPGLSGLWQVCGRSHTTYPERVMMDMHYIDHRCLFLDMQLLLRTVTAVARKSGAC